MITPTFQAQNPAINGYPLGWSSCTCYAGAMAAAFDQGKSFVMTGASVRKVTGDSSGGTTLAQVDAALLKGWQIDLDTRYRFPWTSFAAAIDQGKGAILQGGYGPIADSRFDAGGGFRGNHAVTVLPGWIVMDPLADGRRAGIYKYHGEAYPQALLKAFAGKLDVTGGGSLLGSGLTYAALTRDKVAAYRAVVPAGQFGVYTVVDDTLLGGRFATTGGFSASCTAPRLYRWPGHTAQSLVRLTSGARSGQYIRSTWAKEV